MKLVKLSGQRGQGRVKSTGKTDLGLLEIKLQLLTPTKNLTSLEFPIAYISGIIKVLYMRCLILKQQSPNLKSADRIVQKDTLTTRTHCDPTY